MNHKKLYLFILILLIRPTCNIQSADTTRAEFSDSIPEGAVPFEYEYKLKKAILIPGTLNDSVLLRYMLETGFGRMAFSDSLASNFEIKDKNNLFSKVQKTMKVQIGGLEQDYGNSVDAYYLDKKHPLLVFLGAEGIIPWQFFEKKILEISFSKQYIRVLSSTKDLQDYDSIKMKVENGLLGIPVAVSVQGKKIREVVVIDTGCNGNISFSNNIVTKYGIKSDNAFIQTAHRINEIQKSFSFYCDTIQIGKYSLTQKDRIGFSQDKQRPYPFSGLLGTGILEHFDIVLDLKDYCLYLKPIKNNTN